MKRICILAAILAGLLGNAAHAEDASVANRLNESGMSYEVDDDGDFKLIYSYSKEGRTQIVFVASKTETVNSLTIREVFAPALDISEHGLTGETAIELLNDSSTIKLGSWEIRSDVLYLVAKVREPLNADDLVSVMDAVAESADDMEIKLTGGGDDL